MPPLRVGALRDLPTMMQPLQVAQAAIDACRNVFEGEERRTRTAMLTQLDTQVGRIVTALEQKGKRENTLLFFTMDDGGIVQM